MHDLDELRDLQNAVILSHNDAQRDDVVLKNLESVQDELAGFGASRRERLDGTVDAILVEAATVDASVVSSRVVALCVERCSNQVEV